MKANSTIGPAPNGFIGQLVEHRTGIARSWVQTLLKCWIFFSGFFTQLHKLCSLRLSFLHFHFISFPQFIYDLFQISLTKNIIILIHAKKNNDGLFHLTYGKCMQLCALKCINQMNDTSTCRQQDHFTIWTKFHTCPLNVRVILNVESWKWTLWK